MYTIQTIPPTTTSDTWLHALDTLMSAGLMEQTNTPPTKNEHMDIERHIVQFYQQDAFLISSLTKFIRKSTATIVIATPDHRRALETHLTPGERAGYIPLDAEETLSRFMVEDMPHPGLFFETIGPIVSRATIRGKRVYAFGEMVSLLCARGNTAAALKLEELWNCLQTIYPFSLFCAYPIHMFGENEHSRLFTDICSRHSRVLPAETYSAMPDDDTKLRAVAYLQQRAATLTKEIERRKRLEKQKDEFINVVSHELKTPLTSIKAYAQILAKHVTPEENGQDAHLLKKMNAQITKLTALITDLLDITKIDGGKLAFNQAVFDFDDLVAETVEELQPTTKQHHIVVSGTSGKTIQGDRDRIGQVVANLLSNAIKYSPRARTIYVRRGADDTNALLSVQDFGVGISPHEKAHIFDRFYRAPNGNTETIPGLGLGLYISAEIVRRHNGRIWFKSKKGKETVFHITLPVVS